MLFVRITKGGDGQRERDDAGRPHSQEVKSFPQRPCEVPRGLLILEGEMHLKTSKTVDFALYQNFLSEATVFIVFPVT